MLCTEDMARKTHPPTTEPMGILTQQLMHRLRNRGGVKTTQNQLAKGTGGGGGGGGASDSAEKKCCVLQ